VKVAENELIGTERYAIRRRLGAGASGIIYEALDREHGQRVALKTLRRTTPRHIDRLKEEFRSLANVQHPNLIGLHDLFVVGDKCFFTMDVVQGCDFLTFVRGDGFDEDGQGDRLHAAFTQLVAGIRALHAAGKLHRDIKPSNVLVTSDGRVVVVDFGLVHDLDRRDAAQDVPFAGTPAYMAPEIAFGESASEASDWYSVGTMLYEALSGELPFAGDPSGLLARKRTSRPPPPVPNVATEKLGSLSLDLLQPDPRMRPSGGEIASRLTLTSEVVRVRSRGEPPFIGRRTHLQELEQAFAATRNGKSAVVLVHGESGMGKTRLLHQYLENLKANQDVIVAVGKCYERESAPFKAFDAVISDLAAQLRSRPVLPAAIDRDIGPLLQLFPALETAPILNDSFGAMPQVLDPRERRSRAFEGLRDLLSAFARSRPIVLCVDDLQWGDADSAALFDALFGDPASAPPILFLGTYRSRDTTVSGFLSSILDAHRKPRVVRHMTQLEIGGMTESEAASLANQLLETNTAGGETNGVGELVRESQGCPFLLVELARDWSELSDLGSSDASPSARLEDHLNTMLERRLARISPAARQVLEIVASAGHPIEQRLLHRLAPSSEGALHHVRILRFEKLIRGSGFTDRPLVEAYHDRIRETIAARIEPARMRSLHRELAAALVESGEMDPRVILNHWVIAGDVREVRRYATAAAAQASRNLAFDEAVRYRTLAVETNEEPSEELSLYTGLADALVDAGRGQDAARQYLQASLRTTGYERLALRYRAADQLLGSGRVDEGRHLMEQVLAEQGLKLHQSRGRSLLEYALLRASLRTRGMRFTPRPASEISSGLRDKIDACAIAAADIGVIDPLRGAYFRSLGLRLSLQAGEPVRLSRALALESVFVATAGGKGLEKALELCRSAADLASRAGTEEAWATVEMARGVCHSLSARWRDAVTHTDRAIQAYTERCSAPRQWELGVAQAWGTAALFYLGEFREVSKRLPVYLERANERGDIYTASSLSVSDGVLTWLLEGDAEKPRRVIRSGISRWANDGFYPQHWLEIHALSYVDLYEGDCASVLRRFEERWSEIRRSFLLNVQTCRGTSSYLRGSAALRLARSSPSRLRLLFLEARCERRLFAEGMPWTRGMGFLLRAGRMADQDRMHAARTALRHAAREFELAEMPLWRAVARLRLASLTNDDHLASDARQWMSERGVQHIDRVVSMLSPWPIDPRS
jgi:Cdc6-like AAA superfamily ATPase